ncbi:FxSxx-COOH system tetratricopeptide repeat protein [Streptomyces sp. NPDC087844]|uniref:FxSxx-COOH system tetratricopeptide repeat protein n=1 Tax=Streptomyces sp. NPDC087844 TaxID=3365805 RepID=UPI00380A08C1
MTARDPERFVNISAEGAGSVAAQEINGPVHVGNIIVPAEEHVSPSDVMAPSGANNLPQPRNSLFIGRERELRSLRSVVETYDSAVIAQTMHGLGGVGKTALALQYAHKYRSRYTLVWWISAENPESITSGLASLGFRLNPRMSASGMTSTQSSEWAIAWLQHHSGWLLVLDNAEDPQVISPLIGKTQSGHYLITSRISVGWHYVASPIGLDVLSPDESVELLTRISEISDEETKKRELSSELGFLPLALDQAAAYIHYNKISVERYLNLLRRIPEKALSATAAIGSNSNSVAKTWLVTLQSIRERNPLAISILRSLAWLSPDDIPRGMLYSFSEDEFDVDDALGLLSSYSMISLTPHSISIHRLVQAVIRASEDISAGSLSHPHVRAAIAIYEALDHEPEISPASWSLWRRVVPHVEALSYLVPTEDASPPVHSLLYYAARFLKSQNQLEPAIKFAEKCVEMAEADQGEESDGPDLLSCMNILGATLQVSGFHDRSVKIFRDLVSESVIKYGPLDPFTLSMKNNLASAFQDAGMMTEAVEIFEQTLKEREEILPVDDSATMTSRHNLASAYRITGKPHLAVPILERVVEERKEKYGERGVGTLNSMFNLAIAYIDSGNLIRAVKLLKHVLSEREVIFGPDDPNVIGARRRLGDAYRKAGNSRRSIPIYEENLASAIRAYGPDHAKVIEHGMPLAFSYQDVREQQKAIPLLRRVLEWQESMHGTVNESVIMARNNLAVAHWLDGEIDIASGLLEQSLLDSASALGADHKVVRAVRLNLQRVKSGTTIRGAIQFDIGSLYFGTRG